MLQINNVTNTDSTDSSWKVLHMVGGVAALIAGILFRRNLAVEIGLFNKTPNLITVNDWFTLLRNNRLLGLTYLHIFDLVNYALLSLMFLALYSVLKQINKSLMIIATTLSFVGITTYFASNTAFSMLSLSEQYSTATTDVQRTMLLAAGQSMLAINRFTNPGGHPGAGGFISLFLIAVAGMIISIVMIQSKVFKRATAYVGILASTLDLAYCMAYALVPTVDSELLAVCFIPAAGLFLMIWHVMVGLRLCNLLRTGGRTLPNQS